MPHEKLALLRSLAMRPSPNIAPSLQPMLDELLEAGYVACGPEGWIATADGCNVIERQRQTVHHRAPG